MSFITSKNIKQTMQKLAARIEKDPNDIPQEIQIFLDSFTVQQIGEVIQRMNQYCLDDPCVESPEFFLMLSNELMLVADNK